MGAGSLPTKEHLARCFPFAMESVRRSLSATVTGERYGSYARMAISVVYISTVSGQFLGSSF
jgi:hypothetical protein